MTKVDGQTFHRFISRCQNLYSEQQQKQDDEYKSLTIEFSNFIESFRPLYDKTVEECFNKIILPFQKQHRDLFTRSLLEVIDRHKRENYHSKILAHIWKQDRKALCTFLNHLKMDDSFIQKVAKSQYYISCEKPDRIDIFITDNRSWAIAIENKVKSIVHNRGHTDKLQLTYYKKCVEKKFPKSKYDHCFILLSHRDNTGFLETEQEWRYCTYAVLLKSLLEIENPDRLTREYQSTLLGLLLPNKNLDLKNVQKSLHSINQFRIFEDE
jgi:hypothetical protein